MSLKRTAYAHREVDVSKKLISKPSLLKANGALTVVPFGDYFRMYKSYVQGRADEHGVLFPGEQHDAQELEEARDSQLGEPERCSLGGDFCSPQRHPGNPPTPADMCPGAGTERMASHWLIPASL